MKWGGIEINTARLKSANTGTSIEDRLATIEAASNSAPAGLFIPTKPISRVYYANNISGNSFGTLATTANYLYLSPFIPINTLNIDLIATDITTVGTAGATGRIFIFSDENGAPKNKLLESVDLNCTTTGYKSYTTTFTFNTGITYWLGWQTNITSTCRTNSVAGLPGIAAGNINGALIYTNAQITNITYGNVGSSILVGFANFNNTPTVAFKFRAV